MNDLRDISVEALYSFINDFPALLWRIEIVKARIEFLNGNTDVAPGIDGALFLKNIEYRNRKVLQEDLHLIEDFMEAVKEGENASTVFRVKSRNGVTSWLKLTGTVNRSDPGFYYGYLLNAGDTVAVVKEILGVNYELKLKVEESGNPVLLVNSDSLQIDCASSAAKELFGLSETDFKNLPFRELQDAAEEQDLDYMAREISRSGEWKGRLSYRSKDKKQVVEAETIVRYLVYKKNKLIHISLQKPQVRQPSENVISISSMKDMDALAEKLAGLHEMNDIMDACLSDQMLCGKYDALLFSDVHIRKNMVMVYGAGVPFAGVKQAESFSYKGTIAEDIERYGLESLVVDDTQDSIKPIDWALFVPRGIRSYFAMPFYSRTVLRTVLILCSTTPGFFAGKRPDDYLALLKVINGAVRAWRRHHRR